MLFSTPQITPELQEQLAELDDLRRRLGQEASGLLPWLGRLRRVVRAASVNGSISIEGFQVPEDEAVALVSREESPDPDDADRMAMACYARAMDHVGVLATDPGFRWVDRVIKDLHFDACYFQRDQHPGHWRTGSIGVTAPDGRSLVYEGPDGDDVAPLMAEVVDWMANGDRDAHVVVRGAMAHFHVVSVHPFEDGNGRISRIVQSLVLAQEGLVSLEFGSIEEYLADNTEAYYDALQEVQGGRYQPERDASRWVAFCIEAHIAQARQRLAQIEEAAARWSFLEELVASRGWPDRLVIALEQALVGGTDRSSYVEETEISAPTASADFRRLLDGGLVKQRGRGRNIRYDASDTLRSDLAAALKEHESRAESKAAARAPTG